VSFLSLHTLANASLGNMSYNSDGGDASVPDRVQGSIIAMWALALLACTLRWISRKISKSGLWYDDWLIIPALVSIPLRVIWVAGVLIHSLALLVCLELYCRYLG